MNAKPMIKDFVLRQQAWLHIQGLTGTIRTSLTPWEKRPIVLAEGGPGRILGLRIENRAL